MEHKAKNQEYYIKIMEKQKIDCERQGESANLIQEKKLKRFALPLGRLVQHLSFQIIWLTMSL